MRDLHIHTTFSDGRNSPEEMVLEAIRRGLTEIGISDHSYTPFDETYCIPKERIQEYKDTVNALKAKYQGQIRVLCGIEQDYYSDEDTAEYDYVIGSVHYIRVDGKYLPVDESAEIQRHAVEDYFGGDFYAFAERYFETVADVVRKTGADIIGHFDLLAKFNLFDESHPRYVRAWKRAVDALIPWGKPFEINTGAMSRGYRSIPYPNGDMIDYIRSRGGALIPSSDSHRAQTICYGFDALK